MAFAVSARAYCVLAMHALKHGKRDVVGALLGKDGEADDAVPLRHDGAHLGLLGDVQMTAIAKYAEARKMEIVGIYYGPARGEKRKEVPPFVAKLADIIGEKAAVLLLDAERAEEGASALGVQLFAKAGGHWACTGDHAHGKSSGNLGVSGDVASLVDAYVSEGRHRKIADFDDHLEDVTADWRNPTATD